MAEKNPNKLYDNIKALQDSLEAMKNIVEDIKEKVKTTLNDSNEFGGVVARVFKEQLGGYLTPKVEEFVKPIQEMINGNRIPGSLKDLTIFLDSVPLAMIREEPNIRELASPVIPKDVNLNTPASGKVESDVDSLPREASYQKGIESIGDSIEEAPVEEAVQESLNIKNLRFREGITKYLVVRSSSMGSILDKDTSNISDTVVYEFDSKEEADSMAKKLNSTLTQEEKELLGTEYSVKENWRKCEENNQKSSRF